MDGYHEIQLSLQAKISNSYANFKAKGESKMSRSAAETRLKGLEDNYRAFCENHNKILATKNVDKTHLYFTSKLMELVEESYYDKKAEFKDFLHKLDERDRANAGPANTSLNQSSIQSPTLGAPPFSSSLPKIEVPKFSGKLTDWSNFRDLFRSMIHRRDDISSVFKLYYLKMSVEGEALDKIKNYEMTEENYTKAWSDLCDFYENKRRLVGQAVGSLFAMRNMKAETFVELKKLYTGTFDCLNALESLGRSVETSGNDLLVQLTVSRFDHSTRKDWEKLLGNTQIPPSIDQLKKFFQNQMATLESIENSTKPSSSSQAKSASKLHALATNEEDEPIKKLSCSLCSEGHSLSQCKSFKAKSPQDRCEFAKSKKLCFSCLGAHYSKFCKSKKRCQVCSRKHHTLIHLERSSSDQAKEYNEGSIPYTAPLVEKDNSQSKQSPSCLITQSISLETDTGSDCTLLPTVIVKVTSTGKEFTARALIDQCSQRSFISEALCQKLSVKRTKGNFSIGVVGDVKTKSAKGVTSFTIMPWFESDYSLEVEAIILPKITGYRPTTVAKSKSWKHLDDLQLADPRYLADRPIDLLLGVTVHARIVQEGIKKGSDDQPIATKTKLGWIISSTAEKFYTDSPVSFHCVDNAQLDSLLEKFWIQEEIKPPESLLTPEELECEDHFLKNYSQTPEGRYIVKLPLKLNDLQKLDFNLGDSYTSAFNTLLAMERKFRRNPDFKLKYHSFMREYRELSHMEPVPQLSQEERKGCYFLPHHGVMQGAKKLRTVFNGSSKIHGISLNDLLLQGPNLIPDLPELIMKWRTYEFVFVADIEKMFRQVLVHPDDRHLQMILWREDPEAEVIPQALKTVTYGMNCSIYLAIRCLQQLASDYGHIYPLAVKIVLNESYVDDFISGGNSLEQAREKQRQLIELLKVGGFELRKWAASNAELEDWIPPEHRIRESAHFESHDSTSILGLFWSPQEDCFHFKINLQHCEAKGISKRKVLSLTAKIFDPLGWLAPVVIVAKIFMQSLWLLKCDWDDELPSDYAQRWIQWYSKLKEIEDYKIPRWLGSSTADAEVVEVHGFADASSKAYGAVIYIRIIRNGQALVKLQCSKTKVAPVKTISIPRLELCAAHLLAKLASRYLEIMSLKHKPLHLWTDSKDVLFWIRAIPSKWQTFVANRCSSIQTLVPQAYWHHIRTKENPADVISRGMEATSLKSHDLWWKGPELLAQSLDTWPTEAENIIIKPLEVSKSPHSHTAYLDQKERIDPHYVHILEKFSSLNKLLRFTCFYIRLILKISTKLRKELREKIKLLNLEFLELSSELNGCLKPSELATAEKLWVYLVQRYSFKKEFKCLEAKQPINSPSLLKLSPFLNKGLIRIGGRLNNSALSYEEKHQLVLPKKNHLVTLIIREIHQRVQHGGTQVTLHHLRLKYWVLKGRQAVKSIISSCTICLRYSAKPESQIMGSLPKERVTPALPFEHTGVDFAGPFKLRMTKSRGKGTLKAYISVFVCLSTRAVHLEVVEDYSTEAFIAAFKRFTSRRGHCSILMSDQGTNFIGADAELKRRFVEASNNFKGLVSDLANQGTLWKFNPPAAPHFGGIWEAAVKSAKHHLKRIVGEHVLTFVEFATLLCQVEACLNSRPLTTLNDDPSSSIVLTPAHFLIQRPSFILPEPLIAEKTCTAGKRWQWVTHLSQKFWSEWSKDYLQALQERHKWSRPKRSFLRGDIVLLRDGLHPPAKWPLAIVSKTFPGQDGHVRVVEVKTAKSTYTRPIVKLVLLVPAAQEEDERRESSTH